VCFVRTVGEVQAEYVYANVDKPAQDFGCAGRRPDRRNNFCPAARSSAHIWG
jgi:hypothetical protein